MSTGTSPSLRQIAGYYSARLAEHGETARGVDWNGEESQLLRFRQLCQVINAKGAFSVNDLGCGYGALYDFLCAVHPECSYLGADVSADMVRAAKARHRDRPLTRFIVAAEPDRAADYGIASGIFNVRLGCPDEAWLDHITDTLAVLDRTSRRGFAFNCLTSYSDPGRMRAELYYADPCRLFDLCKRRFSPQVALLHDYGIFEFTILVRKE